MYPRRRCYHSPLNFSGRMRIRCLLIMIYEKYLSKWIQRFGLVKKNCEGFRGQIQLLYFLCGHGAGRINGVLASLPGLFGLQRERLGGSAEAGFGIGI